jgi:hypothetical protein
MLTTKFIVAPLLLLTGCAMIPLSPSPTLPVTTLANGAVMLTGDTADQPILKAAEEAVRVEFVRRGVRVIPQATVRAEVTLARRNPAVGYNAASRGNGVLIDAKPQDGRLDLCHDQVFRLSVAVFEVRNAKVIYRGAGERLQCGELDADDLAELAKVALGGLL